MSIVWYTCIHEKVGYTELSTGTMYRLFVVNHEWSHIRIYCDTRLPDVDIEPVDIAYTILIFVNEICTSLEHPA